MTPQSKLKEADTIEIFRVMAGCYVFIEMAKEEIKRRQLKPSEDV